MRTSRLCDTIFARTCFRLYRYVRGHLWISRRFVRSFQDTLLRTHIRSLMPHKKILCTLCFLPRHVGHRLT